MMFLALDIILGDSYCFWDRYQYVSECVLLKPIFIAQNDKIISIASNVIDSPHCNVSSLRLGQASAGQVLCYTNVLFGKYFTNRTTTMLTFSFFLFLLQASICEGSTGVCCPSSSLWLSYVSPSVCQYPQRVPHQRPRQGWQPSERCSKKCPWWTGKTLKHFIL